MARQDQDHNEGSHGLPASGAMKTAAAAAATGAVTYAVTRMTRRNASASGERRRGDERDEREDSGNGVLAKKDELAETLSSRAAGVKDKAAKLRPKRKTSLPGGAWDAASDYLLPFAGEAAAAAGKAAAERGPDVLRKTIIPRFIDAFEKAS